MAGSHPIAAGLFLVLAVGGAGAGVVKAVRGQRETAAREVKEAEETQRRLIADGVARGQTGDLEGAAGMLAEALRRDPHDDDAAYNLGIALSALGRVADAEKVFSMLLARAPEDWAASAELAAVYDAQGDAERAMQLLEKIPASKGELGARLESEDQWHAVREHARFGALLAKHGIEVKTSTGSGGL